jgi:predicted nucleic acid-binding protein
VIVLDASAGVDWLLGRPAADRVAELLAQDGQSVHVPHLWAVEVAQVLRRLAGAGTLAPDRALQALGVVRELPASRYAHEPLVGRAWQMRATITAYDGVYVALAEALGAPLITTDARLARAPGHRAAIELVGG